MIVTFLVLRLLLLRQVLLLLHSFCSLPRSYVLVFLPRVFATLVPVLPLIAMSLLLILRSAAGDDCYGHHRDHDSQRHDDRNQNRQHVQILRVLPSVLALLSLL